MAKLKGKGVVVAGLLAGAASFLSKKENRDKAMDFFNETKTKATKAVDNQKQNFQGNSQPTKEVNHAVGDVAGDAAESLTSKKSLKIEENRFVNEGGAQQTINEYNKQQ